MLIIIKYLIIIIICLHKSVDSQICTKNELVPTSAIEVYTRMVETTYRGLCPGGSYVCTYRKHSPMTFSRTRMVMRMQVKRFCCDGYIRTDDLPDDSNIQCKPICIQPCVNGYCRSPGKCSCDDGYVPIITDSSIAYNVCRPVCTTPCEHATCTAPETCTCHFGYDNSTGTCQPVCTEPCHNGVCSAPETCSCLPGFRENNNNFCEPYCSHGCENGICLAPENCTCLPGYELSVGNDLPGVCQPTCLESCENGYCSAPGTCACNPGYELTSVVDDLRVANTCKPVCSDPCRKGNCIAPNICDESYEYESTTFYEDDMDVSTTSDGVFSTLLDGNSPTVQITDIVSTTDSSNKEDILPKNTRAMEYSIGIVVPLMLLVLITALIWKCSPIVLCFPQRFYVVQAPAVPHPFENVQFSEIRDKEMQDTKVNVIDKR